MCLFVDVLHIFPDSKVHWANMGPIWGWQDPGWLHVGPMNFAIWVINATSLKLKFPDGDQQFKLFELNLWELLSKQIQLNLLFRQSD